MQIKLVVLISLGLSAMASPIIDADSNGKITGPRPYKVFNHASTIDSEKRDNPKIIGPRPYKVFGRGADVEARGSD
ncbi:hypothetical protein F5B18DRAFT_201829 [Nemania serpens]|nr:hypothetical protein F5B18DRAFT_201829 [Nemania serpens]